MEGGGRRGVVVCVEVEGREIEGGGGKEKERKGDEGRVRK